MYKPLPRTAVPDVSCVDGFASAAPAIKRPVDNEVRGAVCVCGWWEVPITIPIQTTITRRIKITMAIRITITIPIRITITVIVIVIIDRQHG